MSEIVGKPAPRPPGVYEAEHPGSSLAIWATALILQLGMYPLLFLFDVSGPGDSIGAMVETVLSAIWLLIPFAGILGVRAGLSHLGRRPGSLAAWTGIFFNMFHILFGAFLLMLLVTGVRV